MNPISFSPQFSARKRQQTGIFLRQNSGHRIRRRNEQIDAYENAIANSPIRPAFSVELGPGEPLNIPKNLTSYDFNGTLLSGAKSQLQPTMQNVRSGELLVAQQRPNGLIILENDTRPTELPQLETISDGRPRDIVFADEVPSETVRAILERPFNPEHLPKDSRKRRQTG